MTEHVLQQWINPATRSRTRLLRDSATGLPLIQKVQDVRPSLDANQRDANNFDGAKVRRNPAGLRHIARIPMVVIQQLRHMGIIEGMTVVDEVRFMRFLSDSQVRKLRCDDGARLG